MKKYLDSHRYKSSIHEDYVELYPSISEAPQTEIHMKTALSVSSNKVKNLILGSWGYKKSNSFRNLKAE